jgi:hypothetical protein
MMLAVKDRVSALGDAGDFLKRSSVEPAGRSAIQYFELMLITQMRHYDFPKAGASKGLAGERRRFSGRFTITSLVDIMVHQCICNYIDVAPDDSSSSKYA